MSHSVRLLTEEESAQIAEVSIDTIRKYRDCGLLDPIVKDNSTFFQELDIRTLFYAKFKEREQRAEPEPSHRTIDIALASVPPVVPPVTTTTVSLTTPVSEAVNTAELESAAKAEADAAELKAAASQAEVRRQEGAPQTDSGSTAQTMSQPTTQTWGDEPFVIELGSESELRNHSEPIAAPDGGFEQSSGAEKGPISGAKNDLTGSSLPAANELLEINKSLREQIHILRDERDWLRERVEKLESRSEREQMLLMSESENVRKLINSSKKSFWQRALPWLNPDTN